MPVLTRRFSSAAEEKETTRARMRMIDLTITNILQALYRSDFSIFVSCKCEVERNRQDV
jgi:hypothetical protein